MDFRETELPDHDSLYHIAFAACGDHNLAEDLAAEGVVRVLVTTQRRLENAEPEREIDMSWYHVVIKNLARDEHRKERRSQREPEAKLQIAIDPADSPAERAERQEMLGAVAEEFAGLPESLRQILQLRIFEGMSMKDASAALQVPIGTLEKRVRRGLETLRERFERRHLAGGVSVAAAIRNSGEITRVTASRVAIGAGVKKLVASLLVLFVGVGGLTWGLLWVASAEDDPADLVPPTRIAQTAEPGEGASGPTDEGMRREAALGSAGAGAPGATAQVPGDGGAPESTTPASTADTYECTVRIRINGRPADDWIGVSAEFEPFAQPLSRSPRIVINEPVEADATGAITYALPVEPRGEWQIALIHEDVSKDPAKPRCYIHVHMDPQSAVAARDDGSRVIDLDVGLTSRTFEEGKRTYTPNALEVQLITELAPGVWGIGVLGEENTGDDMVFREVFVGRNRLCRIPMHDELTDPGGYASVEPAWQGDIEPR